MTDLLGESGYRFLDRVATPDEHRILARSVDWDDHFDWASIPASLAGSLTGVMVLHDDEPAGMGRIVGDGVHYFYIQDVIVHPDHAEGGIGSAIVDRLVDWIASTCPARAFVGLFASDEAIGLYRKAGFVDEEDMLGMHRFVDPAARV
jgi:GNAT superfamily N-acetyltransferase